MNEKPDYITKHAATENINRSDRSNFKIRSEWIIHHFFLYCNHQRL